MPTLAKEAQLAAASVVSPEKLAQLEQTLAQEIISGPKAIEHLKNSFKGTAAKLTDMSSGAVEATSAMEASAHRANSALMFGATIATVVPQTGTPVDFLTQSISLDGAGSFLLGAVDKAGGAIGSTVAAVGGAVGLKNVKGLGEGITSNTNNLTYLPKLFCETVGAPIKYLREHTVSDILSIPSQAVEHIHGQLIKATGVTSSVKNGAMVNVVDGAKQITPLTDFVQPPAGNWNESLRNKLHDTKQSLGAIEQNAGKKIGGIVDNVFGGKAEAVKDWAQNASIHRTAMQATSIASSVAQDVKTAHTFIAEYEKLKDFFRNVKGLEPEVEVSPKDVLASNDVPQIYKNARSDILCKAPLAVVASFASNLGSWKIACSQNMQGIQGFGAMIGIGAATHALMGLAAPKSDMLDLHETASNIYAAKGELPSALIADFIKVAAPDFGGAANQIKLDVLAAHYNKLQLSPAQLLGEISSGQVAGTAYLLVEARNEKMVANDLTDYPETRQMQRLSKDSPITVPVDSVYSYSMIKSAGDNLPALTSGMKELLLETQPSFGVEGKNNAQLEQVAGYMAQQMIARQTQPHEVVCKSTADMATEAMQHLQVKSAANNVAPFTQVHEGKSQGMAIAASPMKIGVSA